MDGNVSLLLIMEVELDIYHICILLKLTRNEQETVTLFLCLPGLV